MMSVCMSSQKVRSIGHYRYTISSELGNERSYDIMTWWVFDYALATGVWNSTWRHGITWVIGARFGWALYERNICKVKYLTQPVYTSKERWRRSFALFPLCVACLTRCRR